MNAGIRRPGRSFRICLALLVASLIALVSGIVAMTSAGAETTASAIAIALGGLDLAFLAWSFAERQRRGRRSDGTPA